MPRIVQVPGHNHTSVVAHLGSADGAFAAALLDFVAAHAGPLPITAPAAPAPGRSS